MTFHVSDEHSHCCLQNHTKTEHVVCAYSDAAAEVEYPQDSNNEYDKSIT